jgi:exportin-2 (importin alpha re-exporter)
LKEIASSLPSNLVNRYCGSANTSKLEARLWEPFSYILNEDVTEFVPYVFQIFAALLESEPSTPLPENFKSLLGPLTTPALWDVRGNVPGCARFLTAVIPKAVAEIQAGSLLETILGIFQKLVQGKKTEQNAFDILEAIVASFPGSALDAYFVTLLTIILNKLQTSPSDSYKSRFVRFYHLVSARVEAGYGADYFIKHSESLQAGVFVQIYLNIILQTTSQFARPVDRKLGVVSFTKTLCESQSFAQRYQKGWGFTCNNLLDLLKNAPKVTAGVGDEIITEADVDDIGFGIGFTPLTTCKRGPRDDFPKITNVESWVSEYLKAANQRHGGAIANFANDRLEPDAKRLMGTYLQ